MVEQLSQHGVIPADISPALIAFSKVKNPIETTHLHCTESDLPLDNSSESKSPVSTAVAELDVQSPFELSQKETLDLDIKWTVLCDLFLVLLADSVYDSRSRVFMQKIGKMLHVDWIDISRFEKRVTDALEIQENAHQGWTEKEHVDARQKLARNKRYVMMGLATLGGSLVIGLSAGLLFPVIGAGLGAAFTTIGVGGTAGFLTGAGGAAMITTTGVATGGTIAARGMSRRTEAVKTFEFKPLHNNKRVNLIITVSGYILSCEC